MAQYLYPATPFDRAETLLAVLGTFWADIYAGKDQALATSQAVCLWGGQALLDTLETIAALSRFTVPLFHKENWYLLTLRASQRNTAATSLARFDAGVTYDSGLHYDVPPATLTHAFPAPADLAASSVIMNRLTAPSLTWTYGLDFTLSDGAIIFRENPFDDTRVAKRPVYEAGVVVDEEVALWLWRADFDWQIAYRSFGYVLGLRLQSSSGYRDLLNAVFDAIVGGTAKAQIQAAASAITGIPLARDTETVEDIWMDTRGRLVVTDRNIYRFHADATVSVAVGDALTPGDSMVDALAILEFNRGECPDDLLALATGRGFVSSCLYGDLIWENRDVPLTVITTDPSGFTKLTWPLGGFPLDVEAFFDELHTRGVAEATAADPCESAPVVTYPGDDCDTFTSQVRCGTLGHLLDRRTDPVGEPTAAQLPTTINPLKFLITNILRNNASALRLKVNHVGPTGLGLHNLRLLTRIVPPHTALLILLETSAQPGELSAGGISSELTTFTAAAPVDTEFPAASIDVQLRARVVSGTCQ